MKHRPPPSRHVDYLPAHLPDTDIADAACQKNEGGTPPQDSDTAFAQIASLYANDGLVVQSLDGIILWANPAYCSLMGRPLEQIVGRDPLTFCLPDGEELSDHEANRFRQVRTNDHASPTLSLFRNRHASGRLFWNQISQSMHQYPDGRWVVILVCRDVSAQIAKEQQLERTTNDLARLAACDPLTGLANRSALAHFLEDHLGPLAQGKLGLLHIDLDKFKALNDQFGHSAGDTMLVHVADCLRDAIRHTDMAARIGGDEFVVALPDITSLNDLQKIGTAISTAISKPVQSATGVMRGNACVGVALARPGSETVDQVIRHADFALYDAKRRGKGAVATYDHDMDARYSLEKHLSEELLDAVAQDKLSYHFQPTMCLQSGQINGFETLVRWQHPRLGLCPPDTFLPLAQKLGLMAEIDFGAMRAAFALKKCINQAAFSGIRVGFNGSAEVLRHPAFFERLSTALADNRLTAADVVIEVLESVVFHAPEQSDPVIGVLKRLADDGFTTLLDDFGTGYAGLAHLAQLPVTGLKIDRSMTSKISDGGPDAKIIAMIHDLCADLGLYVVTEGIETAEAAARVQNMGGRTIQGYWLSKPMPADHVINWMQTRPDIFPQIAMSAIAPMPRQRYLGANS